MYHGRSIFALLLLHDVHFTKNLVHIVLQLFVFFCCFDISFWMLRLFTEKKFSVMYVYELTMMLTKFTFDGI